MLESSIQSKIKKRLESFGWYVVKLIQTSANGIPDLMALRSGRTVFVEVKRPGQKPTELQLWVHEKLKKQGFEVRVVDSPDLINDLK